MAAAADNAVTKGIVSPIFLACVCLEHMIVVVRILGLNEGELADATLFDQLLRTNEAGGVAADLTNHELLIGLLCSGNDRKAILLGESQGLLAENVKACIQAVLAHFPVQLVGRSDNDGIQLLLRDHFLIIGIERAAGKLLGNVYAVLVLSALFNDIAASNNLSIRMCSGALHMRSAHTKTNKSNL